MPKWIEHSTIPLLCDGMLVKVMAKVSCALASTTCIVTLCSRAKMNWTFDYSVAVWWYASKSGGEGLLCSSFNHVYSHTLFSCQNEFNIRLFRCCVMVYASKSCGEGLLYSSVNHVYSHFVLVPKWIEHSTIQIEKVPEIHQINPHSNIVITLDYELSQCDLFIVVAVAKEIIL